MANAGNEQIMERLSALERDMRELLTLVKQIDTRVGRNGADDLPSEERFFDAEGGE